MAKKNEEKATEVKVAKMKSPCKVLIGSKYVTLKKDKVINPDLLDKVVLKSLCKRGIIVYEAQNPAVNLAEKSKPGKGGKKEPMGVKIKSVRDR